MDQQAFINLQDSIMKIKMERDSVMQELLKDKQELQSFQMQSRKISLERDFRRKELNEKEERLRNYEKMVQESQSTYSKLIETSNRLAHALTQESDYLKSKINK